MDTPPATRRSASHGALNTAYTSHAGTRQAAGPCWSLRSPHETALLLRTPGPLEGMLKTTTETGDIGRFSIKSGSFAGSQRPVSSKPGFGENVAPRRPASRASSATGTSFREDRRPWAPYRDTASEILSLYGSGSPRFTYGSLSSPEWYVQRSNSVSSCGSRQIHTIRSNGTLQSQSSRGTLQRPRSPFPYPTRLKRPGVRPSSPALTENGTVDYSRMVEIDRLSSRTAYGSYRPRPSYSHGDRPNNSSQLSLRSEVGHACNLPQQVNPMIETSLRSDYNLPARPRPDSDSTDHSRSNSSLTSIIEKYRHSPWPPTKYAVPSSTFYYDYSEDFDYISEVPPIACVRVAPTPTRAASIRTPVVLRDGFDSDLDIHEDLEHIGLTTFFDEESGPFPQQFGPTVARAEPVGDLPCISALAGSCHVEKSASREPNLGEEEPPAMRSASTSTAQRTSPGTSLPEGLDEAEGALPCQPRVCPDDELQTSVQAITTDSIAESKKTLDNLRPSPDSVSASVKESIISGIPPKRDGTLDHDIRANDLLLPNSVTVGRPVSLIDTKSHTIAVPPRERKRASLVSRFSFRLRGNQMAPLDLGLSHLPTLDGSFEANENRSSKHERISRLGNAEHAVVDLDAPESPCNPIPDGAEGYAEKELRPKASSVSLFRRHRRNEAILPVSTQDLLGSLCASPLLQEEREDDLILSPKPISQAHELKVKNSIPRLMKALPPVPAGDFADVQMSLEDLLLANDFESRIPAFTRKRFHAFNSTTKHEDGGATGNIRGDKPSLEGLPRLRIRFKGLNAGAAPNSSGTIKFSRLGTSRLKKVANQKMRISRSDPEPASQSKPRLKLKISCSALRRKSGPEDTGTVKHRFGVDTPNELSELARQKPKDLFSPFSEFQNPFLAQGSCFQQIFQDDDRSDMVGKGLTDDDQPTMEALTAFRFHRGTSLDSRLEPINSKHPNRNCVLGTDDSVDQRSFLSEGGNLRSHRGLRKRLSALAGRVTQTHGQGDGLKHAVCHTSTRPRLILNNTTSVFDQTDSSSQVRPYQKAGVIMAEALRRRQVRRKLSQWLKDAKRAVVSAFSRR